ncbi:MAG: DNA-directed RNA polymerase subunit omega [Oscillospiraceae bacterium]
MTEMLERDQDCYTFVVAVAKRAREIAENAEEQHEILESKPVQLAVEEFSSGECTIAKALHRS